MALPLIAHRAYLSFNWGVVMGMFSREKVAKTMRGTARKRVERRWLAVALVDGWVVSPIFTRHYDLLVCHHRFSGRVCCTRLLPAGVWAEITAEQREEMGMSFLSRPTATANGKAPGVAAPDDVRSHWPAIGEFLYAEAYPDGSPRQRSTITLMAGDSAGWKLVLNDRQEGRSLWATGESLEDALCALELQLESPNVPWRMDRGFKGGAKKS